MFQMSMDGFKVTFTMYNKNPSFSWENQWFPIDFPNKTNGHSSLQGPPLPRPWASPAAAGLCDGRPWQRCCGGAEGRIYRWRWFYIKVTWGEREPVEPIHIHYWLVLWQNQNNNWQNQGLVDMNGIFMDYLVGALEHEWIMFPYIGNRNPN